MSRPVSSIPFGYKIQKYLHRFPELQYTGTAIKCFICDTYLLGWNTSVCMKHVASRRHITNRKLRAPYWMFLYDLIFVLSVCNIPSHVLNKEQFRSFWTKYIPKWPLPTRQGIQRYVPRVTEQIKNDIRSALRNKKLWITVDETTDIKNNQVGNILVRILTPNTATMPYVLASKRLKQTNAASVYELIMHTVDKFDINLDNLVMVVTDGTPYMIKAASLLKQSCPNVLHITCLLHAFHCLAETVGNCYPDVNTLILKTNQVFTKSLKHIKEFHRLCPGIPEPPQVVPTRWGTWLKAAFYYKKYFQTVKNVICQLDPTTADPIRESQQQFNNPQVEADLHKIQVNYNTLADAIDELQVSSLSLSESLEIVDRVYKVLQNVEDNTGIEAAKKFNNLLDKNTDFAELRQINQCLRSENSADYFQFFTHASIASLDVLHRSILKYDSVFSAKRTCLKESTVEGILIMQAFAQHHEVFTQGFWAR